MSDFNSDRNLLYGILAMQLGFISDGDLISAVSTWARSKSIRLDEVLLKNSALTSDVHEVLNALVEKHLAQHEHDVQKSLAAVSLTSSIRGELSQIGDPIVETSLAEVSIVNHSVENGAAPRPRTSGKFTATGDRFQILRKHAEGGLGQVSVALDCQLNREVALKEIKPKYAHDPDCRSRFLQEAEVTGALEHPSIVPVYGLGTRSDGTPFYAMRLIRGDSLKDAIKRYHKRERREPTEHGLEQRKLIAHFVAACNAMEYSHSRGILHRDIKPANVMLGEYGETLVVDWGLAKIIGSGGSRDVSITPIHGSSHDLTTQGRALGTPAYMSPEQAAGHLDDLGPTSDVYSLGATLYSILTGRSPFTPTKGTDMTTILEKVKEGRFPKPRDVSSRVARQLEAICLKAMAHNPASRYHSCRELAADLERWLADEPVACCPETFADRSGRWMRHHRGEVQAGFLGLVAVVLVLAVAVGMIQWSFERERTAHQLANGLRLEAVTRFEQSLDATNTWLIGAGEALKYYPGTQEARERLLDRATSDLANLTKQESSDAALELQRAKTFLLLGNVRLELQDLTASRRAYVSAEAILTKLATRGSIDPRVLRELANSQTNLARVAIERGILDEANRRLQEAIGELTKLLTSADLESDVRSRTELNLAEALIQQTDLLDSMGRTDEATQSIENALSTLSESPVDRFDATSRLHTTVRARTLLGQMLTKSGELQQAEVAYRASLEDIEQLLRMDPGHVPHLHARANTTFSLAGLYRETGRVQQENEAFLQAISDFERLQRAMPGALTFQTGMAGVQIGYGQLLYHYGLAAEARDVINSALNTLGTLREHFRDNHSYIEKLATAMQIQGRIQSDLSEMALAEPALQYAVDQLAELTDEFSDQPQFQHRHAIATSHLAQAQHKRGDFDAASVNFTAAVDIAATLSESQPAQLTFLDTLASVKEHQAAFLKDTEREEQAATLMLEVLSIRRGLAEPAEAALSHVHRLAELLVTVDNPAHRDGALATALGQRLHEAVPNNPTYLSIMGAAAYRTNDYQLAEDYLEQAGRLRGFSHAFDTFFLAMARWDQGDTSKAREDLARARQWLRDNLPGSRKLRQLEAEAVQKITGSGPDSQ